MKVAPSILACDFSRLREEIETVDRCGIDLLHLDIMDGVFVPNITFGPVLVKAIKKISDTPLDAHLMITKPERYIDEFAKAGADFIVFHIEATDQPALCLQKSKDCGVKVGIAVNPKTELKEIIPYIDSIDLLLIMSVEPGFSGQKFIPQTLKKIKRASDLLRENSHCILAVDGGVNTDNAQIIAQNGADLLVAASAIFESTDYCTTIDSLRCLNH